MRVLAVALLLLGCERPLTGPERRLCEEYTAKCLATKTRLLMLKDPELVRLCVEVITECGR